MVWFRWSLNLPHFRGLAADCPLLYLSHFQTFTLTVSNYVVVEKALGVSSNSRGFTSTMTYNRKLLCIFSYVRRYLFRSLRLCYFQWICCNNWIKVIAIANFVVSAHKDNPWFRRISCCVHHLIPDLFR